MHRGKDTFSEELQDSVPSPGQAGRAPGTGGDSSPSPVVSEAGTL